MYHARTRLSATEDGLLVDPGAVGNLMGSEWFARQSMRARQHGKQPQVTPLNNALNIEGVGSGSQQCVDKGTVACALRDGTETTFSAPIVPNSEIPALLGLESLSQKRALLDTYSKKLYLVGPGGYSIKLSPGSTVLDLQSAPSGHLLLPVSEFDKLQPSTTAKANSGADKQVRFLSTDQ